jgi:two-component system nitrate/nitrite response regulator NarL
LGGDLGLTTINTQIVERGISLGRLNHFRSLVSQERTILISHSGTTKSVVVCDTQPLAIEGLRAVLSATPGIRFAGAMTTLAGTIDLVRGTNPAVVILDRAFGAASVILALDRLRGSKTTASIVWGVAITNSEALRFMQSGARGVLRKTSDTNQVIDCIRTVANGDTWMEDMVLLDPERVVPSTRSNLTAREHQVAELVEKGLKNKDIAGNLGIRTGTVKIHLKHIFEKTGCRGRYGLALTGLREKGLIPLSM